ncbi:MAG: cytochrome c-type biogenesis protein [Marinobacter sp.]|uniref:cytochrome c-type biogenesis protein n=1 Tax=Marinobacter sp. TaxID=50741 RepID=UPI0034A053D5
MIRLLTLALMLTVSGLVFGATSDVYPLESEADRERFRDLTKELRCPKCQNQNIADSNAPIAEDMKNEVYRMVREGATDEEVFEALVGRFGEFVRYRPQLEPRTVMLWATPAIVVFGGVLIVIGVVVRSRRNTEGASALTDDQRLRAEKILRADGADTTGDAGPRT